MSENAASLRPETIQAPKITVKEFFQRPIENKKPADTIFQIRARQAKDRIITGNENNPTSKQTNLDIYVASLGALTQLRPGDNFGDRPWRLVTSVKSGGELQSFQITGVSEKVLPQGNVLMLTTDSGDEIPLDDVINEARNNILQSLGAATENESFDSKFLRTYATNYKADGTDFSQQENIILVERAATFGMPVRSDITGLLPTQEELKQMSQEQQQRAIGVQQEINEIIGQDTILTREQVKKACAVLGINISPNEIQTIRKELGKSLTPENDQKLTAFADKLKELAGGGDDWNLGQVIDAFYLRLQSGETDLENPLGNIEFFTDLDDQAQNKLTAKRKKLDTALKISGIISFLAALGIWRKLKEAEGGNQQQQM